MAKADAKGQVAAVNALTLKKEADTYYTLHGRWPAVLLDVAPLLEGGVNALLDPWGETYKYEVAADEQGKERPYIWTERTAGGITWVFGNKLPEKAEKK